MSVTSLVVGAGISGAVASSILADHHHKVILLDKRPHIAGNCYDYMQDGIMIHKYGSHIFHTDSKIVWDFVNRYATFYPYFHKVCGMIDGILTHIPFNLNSIYDLFPHTLATRLEEKLLASFDLNTRISILDFMEHKDDDLTFLAKYIYEKIFVNYTNKQWNLANPNDNGGGGGVKPSINLKNIDPSILARVPVVIGKNDCYFDNKYQGIASKGYTDMIANMLDHKNIELLLECDFNDFKAQNDLSKFDHIFYTGMLDEYFDFCFGRLPYRSLRFTLERMDIAYFQKTACVNYPNNYDFTRIHEYKHYLPSTSSHTYIAREYPSDFTQDSEPYYPIANETNSALYDRYLAKADSIPNLHLLGRLAKYKYYDMDQAILNAIHITTDAIKEQR